MIHIGVSGPGVVKRGPRDACIKRSPNRTLGEIAEEIKSTAFRVTRVGELIGREVAARLGVAFGIVDLSLAPAPKIGDSVGEILQPIGIDQIGAPGSTAAARPAERRRQEGGLVRLVLGRRAVRRVPAGERGRGAGRRGRPRHAHLEKLEAMTSVCSLGLDMVADSRRHRRREHSPP